MKRPRKPKPRNPVARALHDGRAFKQRSIEDKRRKKPKHKQLKDDQDVER